MGGIKESVPDYTLICKCQKDLDIPKLEAKKNSAKLVMDVVIDPKLRFLNLQFF